MEDWWILRNQSVVERQQGSGDRLWAMEL